MNEKQLAGSISRRNFMAGLAGAGAFLINGESAAQTPAEKLAPH
jgi:hypothetical protein